MIERGLPPLYGVIGHPLIHSLSPRLHAAALSACGLPGHYVALPVAPSLLADGLAGLRAFGVAGVNVTIPHKVAVVPLLDGLTELAARVGAVNTLFWEAGRLVGDNTDVGGFLAALPPETPVKGEVLLLGAGGAARAVALAVAARGTEALHVVARAEQGASELRAQLVPAVAGEAVSLADTPALVERAPRCCLVVNATPVGSHGEGSPLPAEVLEALPAEAVVVDLVYRPGDTPLVRRARRRGLVAVDGREMLVRQAALAFERWTGVTPPLGPMREAAGLPPGKELP
ncbi:MAG: shikimate dehydrogenase [Candidatus Sericytochromatia bacterium]|nr:shikimate dehydrogenase [Candidatus Sericytochromatia bacterium]